LPRLLLALSLNDRSNFPWLDLKKENPLRNQGQSLRQHHSITPYRNQPRKLALIVQFAAT